MFFILVDFQTEPSSRGVFDYLSSISLSSGEHAMDIGFRVTRRFASELTANLLALDEKEVTPDDLEDALKEFANMVGGNFQSRMKDEGWQLGIPRLERLSRPESLSGSQLAFSCSGEPVGVVVLTRNHDAPVSEHPEG